MTQESKPSLRLELGRDGMLQRYVFSGAAMFACLLAAAVGRAQLLPDYRHPDYLSPGMIGAQALMSGAPLAGYFQPVSIQAPPGTMVSLAADGAFTEPQLVPVHVGMLIAPVYRLRVSNIPLHIGSEVFPTVELIGRLCPPAGQERRFPIPIELSQEDIELALAGKFVTRVVYVEDPGHALPAHEPAGGNWFDAGPGANPLTVADQLGRPIAIIRLGGRLPDDRSGPDQQFLYGSPPFTVFQPATEQVPLPPLEAKAKRPQANAELRRS